VTETDDRPRIRSAGEAGEIGGRIVRGFDVSALVERRIRELVARRRRR
jgi:hypothetical protein